MTRNLRLVSSRHPDDAAPRGQMSHANRLNLPPLGGRGRDARSARRISCPPVITRHEATAFWADLVARRCGTREACAVMFSVTFQTACNWFDGFSCPTGDKVMMAQRAWPEEFSSDTGA